MTPETLIECGMPLFLLLVGVAVVGVHTILLNNYDDHWKDK